MRDAEKSMDIEMRDEMLIDKIYPTHSLDEENIALKVLHELNGTSVN